MTSTEAEELGRVLYEELPKHMTWDGDQDALFPLMVELGKAAHSHVLSKLAARGGTLSAEERAEAKLVADNWGGIVAKLLEAHDVQGRHIAELEREREELAKALLDMHHEIQDWGHNQDCPCDEDDPHPVECECGKETLLGMTGSALKKAGRLP